MEEFRYDSQTWRRLREHALERDGHVCTIGRFLGGECHGSLHVDHLIPVSEGGAPLDLDNCMTSCASHHPVRHAVRRAVVERREPRQRRCPHRHVYPGSREACERQLNAA